MEGSRKRFKLKFLRVVNKTRCRFGPLVRNFRIRYRMDQQVERTYKLIKTEKNEQIRKSIAICTYDEIKIIRS